MWASYDQPLRPGLLAAPALPGAIQAPETRAPNPRLRLFPQLKLSLTSLLAFQAAPPGNPEAYLKVALYSADSVLLEESRTYLADSIPPGEWQLLQTNLAADSTGYVEVSLHEENAPAA